MSHTIDDALEEAHVAKESEESKTYTLQLGPETLAHLAKIRRQRDLANNRDAATFALAIFAQLTAYPGTDSNSDSLPPA